MLIKLGEYKSGSDRETDEAVEKIDAINDFLKQGLQENPPYEQTCQSLIDIAER